MAISAFVVRVPEAEPRVGSLRERFDSSVKLGVPAHVTVLMPFMPPERINAAVLQQAQAALSAVCAFAFELSEVRRFPAATYLAPMPAAPFIALTQSLVGSFPEYPPYGGQFQSVVPHLTVAQSNPADAELAAAELERMMRKLGPVSSYCSSVVLLENSSGLWKEKYAFALPRASSEG
jgi:2'-5' RNA ligase